MAQVSKVDGNLVSTPGTFYATPGVASEALSRNDLCVLLPGAAGWVKAPAGTTADGLYGLAMQDYPAGANYADFLLVGETNGFDPAVATRGTRLYPSASVAGGLATDVLANAKATVVCTQSGRIFINSR